jgi:hypothetical protein
MQGSGVDNNKRGAENKKRQDWSLRGDRDAGLTEIGNGPVLIDSEPFDLKSKVMKARVHGRTYTHTHTIT